MKNTKSTLLALSTALAILVGCNQTTKNTDGEIRDSTLLTDTVGAIGVNPLSHAKEFPGATLTISSLTSEKVGSDSARITIKYNVSNFNLTEQTDHSHHMANSAEGQHIHFILNNEPYEALYKPEHSTVVPINSEHYLISFLSRSFHESIKTADAHKVVRFKVGADGKIEEMPTPTEPALFYSRPKGEYKGEDTKSILLDFFVTNTTLSAADYKVMANINGQEFTLDQWVPYEILNLPMGENVIKLILVDKDGNAITGDNVSVERKITLTE